MMISAFKRTIVFKNGIVSFPCKKYPDWYGIKGVGFIYHNSWSDPDIEYKGNQMNCVPIEDAMWDKFREEYEYQGKNPDDYVEEFGSYMQEHSDEVYNLIEKRISTGITASAF